MMSVVLIPLFRSFILIFTRMCFEHSCNNSLNPFVQVFYSNTSHSTVFFTSFGKCLNPFVQVFYSNVVAINENVVFDERCLNPFVQVFYSN